MHLTLVVPGLLWPLPALRDTVFDLSLPGLQSLLGRAARSPLAQQDADAWWLAAFGLAPPMPSAPLRLLTLGIDPGDDWWLCADPVHVHFDRQGAVLVDAAALELSAEEARALSDTVAPLLADLGALRADAPSAWHMALATKPPELPARPGETLLPAGDTGRAWRRALNEAQMALHAHPVNQAREASGKRSVNSLMLWGAGKRPRAARPRFEHICSNDPVITGLARAAGIEVTPLSDAPPPDDARTAVHWDGLALPTRMRDALAWRAGLAEFDRQWIMPALAALKSGRRGTLELAAFGEQKGLTLTLHRRDLLKFWRRPQPLAALAA